jgi:multiple sugar transport system permease protein/sn-glycerol 3-phosphate transport system permease protein
MTTRSSTTTVPRASALTARQIRSQRIRALKNFISAMLFLSPSLLIFILFVFIPLLKTVQLSLYLTNPIGEMKAFIGLENYQRIIEEPNLLNSLRVSFTFALYVVPATILLALFLAVLSNVQLRGISVFRVIFSSTIAISGVSISLVFLFLFNPVNGVLNYLLDLANLPRVPWLVSDATALISVSMVTVWLSLGFCTILLLAALQGISQELYESATIDGAGFWQSFRHITLPLISPTIFFLMVVQTLNALQAFAQINILTSGGPNQSTEALVYLIYRSFYFNNQYGVAGAMSVVLFFLMFLLTLIQFGVLERRVFYS